MNYSAVNYHYFSMYLSANLCATFSKGMRGEKANHKNITYIEFNICPDGKYSFNGC